MAPETPSSWSRRMPDLCDPSGRFVWVGRGEGGGREEPQEICVSTRRPMGDYNRLVTDRYRKHLARNEGSEGS